MADKESKKLRLGALSRKEKLAERKERWHRMRNNDNSTELMTNLGQATEALAQSCCSDSSDSKSS